MPIFSSIFQFREEICRKADCLREVADPSAMGVIPAVDAGKLFADAQFAANLNRLRSAFHPLKITPVGSPAPGKHEA
jgi:hypothetical protein